MTPRRRYAFWIDEEQIAALKCLEERDGVLPSEQIRRALTEWFGKRGVKVKAGRKRAATRKRSSRLRL